jgi:hypothetical protein
LQEDDKIKLNLSTPKKGCSEKIQIIWNFGLTGMAGEDPHEGGAPCEQQIIQDVTGVIDSYKRIDREAHGMFVAGLGNSDGRRAGQRQATVVKAACAGGKQTKMTQEEQYAKSSINNGCCWTNMRTQVKRTRIENPDENPDAFIRLNIECD